MYKNSLSLLFFVIFSTQTITGQINSDLNNIKTANDVITLNWQNINLADASNFEEVSTSVLSFQGAVVSYNPCIMPMYNNVTDGAFTYSLQVIETQALDAKELKLLQGTYPSDFLIESNIGYQQKKPFSSFQLNTIRLNVNTNAYEKLIKFSVIKIESKDIAQKIISAPLRTYTNQSVLSAGNWYKVAIGNSGIYKLDYTFFKNNGIDVEGVNPKTIRIFGNATGILPMKNSVFRPNDLIENAISVIGENDNKFDLNDYVLFFGKGQEQLQWNRIPNTTGACANKKFAHKKNFWTDSSYYFINIGDVNGKRIQAATNPSASPVATFITFHNYYVYEKDLVNLVGSGKNFFGEYFDTKTTYDFVNTLPNLSPEYLTINLNVNARFISSDPSQFTQFGVSINDVFLNKINVPSVLFRGSSQYIYEIVNEASGCATLISPTGNTAKTTINYEKKNNTFGYLDFFELHYKSFYNFNTPLYFFRNLDSIKTGNAVILEATNVGTNTIVWDITDPKNVAQINFNLNSSNASILVDASKDREFVAFNGLQYFMPTFLHKLTNQNLHAINQADYIVVTHHKFLEEAEKIAQLHRDKDSLSAVVVSTEQIYNEFSGGAKDIIAIKDFVKMLYDRNLGTTIPKYLLLFGDGSFNYTLKPELNSDFVPIFQSEESKHPVESYCTDDYYGTLDDTEGDGLNDKVDLGIGRFPVKTKRNAQNVLAKIDQYLSKDSYYLKTKSGTTVNNGKNVYGMGDWRNIVCFVADDQDGSLHMRDADALANKVGVSQSYINLDKIFLDNYKQISNAGGQSYPDVKEAILKRLEKGALILNYVGHGGEQGWTGEGVFNAKDISTLKNIDNLPFFVTATCDFGKYDDPARESGGELLFNSETGGGIGLLTTTRPVLSSANYQLNDNFYNFIFKPIKGVMPRLGDVLIPVKNAASTSYANNRKFSLLGDPAMRLAYPANTISTSSINDIAISSASAIVDTVKALSVLKVKGIVTKKGTANIQSNYNGFIYPTIYDKSILTKNLLNDAPGVSLDYSSPLNNLRIQKNIVFKGIAEIKNGAFEFECFIPKDIAQDIGKGKISYYYENGETDGAGFSDNFILTGINKNAAIDNVGPEIKLFLNDENFVQNGLVNDKPVILAKLFDENGINTVGSGIGHDITAVIDENTPNKVVLNDFYNAEVNSYKKGTVRYQLNKLAEGKHNLKFKAFDNYNNSSEVLVDFFIEKDPLLALKHVLNYPNPFTTITSFYFEHNQPFSQLNVQIQIFTVAGKIVKTFDKIIATVGTRVGPIDWDGKDEYGDNLAKGVYLYKVKVRAANGKEVEKFEKLVVLK